MWDTSVVDEKLDCNHSKSWTKNLTGCALSVLCWILKVVLPVLKGSPERGLLPPVQDPVLTLSASQVAQHIRHGKLKSEAVVRSTMDRIRTVQPHINAMIDERFSLALEEARQADLFVLNSGLTVQELADQKPFLGVPFTVKGNIACKGLDFSVGILSRNGIKSNDDATVVHLLREAGGIALASTNIPELCCSWHSSNPIFGATRNPHDLQRTAGGSSGGEAALISCAGSFLGLGNDLAGSLRVPACFNGIYSHKATGGLISTDGTYPPLEPVAAEVFAHGPLCHHAEDLASCLKVLAADNAEKLNLDQEVDISKLKIYYFDDDIGDPLAGKLDNDVKLAFNKMLVYLRQELGLSPERINLPHLDQIMWIFSSKLSAGCQRSFSSILAEDPDKQVSLPWEIVKWLLGISSHELTVLMFVIGEHFSAKKGTPEFERLRRMEMELGMAVRKLLKGDAILLFPSVPYTAPYPAEVFPRFPLIGYFAIPSIFGLPVTQCPLGRSSKNGLPVGIQIIADRYSDRLTIAFARTLEEGFQKWILP